MSGIYIPNMKMPTGYPLWIVVSADGTVQYNYFNEWKTAEEKAVPIPPHGDLIDRDALREEVKKHAEPSDAWVFSLIRTAPTIIGAEEE